MFTMVYAVPRGGQRAFTFEYAEQLAEHVEKNHPGLFAGIPSLGEPEKFEELKNRPYRIPEQKK